VPQVDTVEQARHIVSAAKFGAIRNGTRSAPPARFMPGLSDKPVDPSKTLHECVNDQAAIIIQIETLQAIKNLDEILTECGEYIDSVWLGSLDARVSMGLSGMGGAEPEWLEAVALFESTLAKHNQAVSGFALGPPEVKAMLARGKSFLMVAADFMSIVGNGLQDLASSRADFKQQSQVGIYKRIDV
jgi:4-hydroxy-2-oxoheptanedioate aldolase